MADFTEFVGTAGNDVARFSTGTLVGFTGAGLTQLLDADGDLYTCGAGADTVFAGIGGDLIKGQAGADKLHGGVGDDKFQYDNPSDVSAGEVIDGGAGSDRVLMLGGIVDFRAARIISIENLDFEPVGFSQSARFRADQVGAGLATALHVMGDNNAATYEEVQFEMGGRSFNLAGFTFFGWGADNFIGITGNQNAQTIIGSSQADSVAAKGGNDRVIGGGGNDVVDGDEGSDFLSGDAGNDVLRGLAGNDTLVGGPGSDRLDGGRGNDTFVLGAESDRVVDAAGIDRITSTITRSLAPFGAVEDLVLVGSGQINGIGNALANAITGNSKSNVIDGRAGSDDLIGGAGNDVLVGGAGNDMLSGGLGKDTMTGGAGADDFDFDSVAEIGRGASRDRISDFTHLVDDIDLRTIDANGGVAGNGAFEFLARKGAAFTDARGELRWFQVNAAGTASDRTIIEGDVNGDGVADFQIQLTGLKALGAADFLL
jgi:Ca2+-binding RTX toxin-like protein